MKRSNLSICITGGAGFIGSHLALTLSSGNTVTVVDNFTSNVRKKSQLTTQGVSVITGDVNDVSLLARAFKNIDIVYHLAVAGVRKSLSLPVAVHETNATGTLNALIAAQTAGVKRFIYISSSEVYGSSKTRTMKETHAIDPTTVYGMSKYVGELYTQHFHDHRRMETVRIRPFNSYGPWSHFEGVYGEVIPRFVTMALSGTSLTVFGSGEQTRDFTYITDTVDGLVRAGLSDKLIGDVINIARGEEVSIRNIAEKIIRLTGSTHTPTYLPPRPHDVMRHSADISKAKRVLGYRPSVSIDEGLARYVEWVRTNYPNTKALLKKLPERNW